MFNQYPYGWQTPFQAVQPPQKSVTRVSGVESARRLQLPPNSSEILLDYDDKHCYVAYTDGAGTLTVKPCEIRPIEESAAPEYLTVSDFEKFKEALYERLDTNAE